MIQGACLPNKLAKSLRAHSQNSQTGRKTFEPGDERRATGITPHRALARGKWRARAELHSKPAAAPMAELSGAKCPATFFGNPNLSTQNIGYLPTRKGMKIPAGWLPSPNGWSSGFRRDDDAGSPHVFGEAHAQLALLQAASQQPQQAAALMEQATHSLLFRWFVGLSGMAGGAAGAGGRVEVPASGHQQHVGRVP